jgi:hypothetical protein
MLRRLFGVLGLALVAGCGATVGGWITNKQDPVQFLSRKILTPQVKPGDEIEIELDNYRILRCPQTTYRVISYPNGRRSTQVEDKPAGFGRLGRDKYRVAIPTQDGVPFGTGNVYSYTERRCNPWEWLFPVTYAEPWTDVVQFGPETIHLSPEDAKNSLVR